MTALATALAMAARAEYAQAGNNEAHALAALRAVNELMIVITEQLSSSQAGKPAYPDEAFLTVLVEKSKIGNVQPALHWALMTAIKDSDS